MGKLENCAERKPNSFIFKEKYCADKGEEII